jgi:beta-hydroxyacyl-ACP dehydratase FabZ
MASFDNVAVRKMLPHRYPFLLVDKILSLEPDRVVGVKNVSANEPFFQGHFPGLPVMPGVLIVEAMAQVAGVLAKHLTDDPNAKVMFLATIEEAKFRKPVVPGDQLVIEMRLMKRKPSIVKMQGEAKVDGVVVAEATLMCRLVDVDPPAGGGPAGSEA